MSSGFAVFQVKDDGLLDDEGKEEEEMLQPSEKEGSVIGIV